MGSFVFKWNHPATEVYVTGTFDDWKKTEKLDKVGDAFQKTVALTDISSKILYKFVVDGEWITDHTAPRETDSSGNENNVLTLERIVAEAPATTAIMSSAAPISTTAALAADVPLENKEGIPAAAENDVKVEKEEKSDLPGAFPETPAAEPSNEGSFGVNPLPAAAGAVNPIKLAPGEKIPEDLAAQSATSNVRLDPESYAQSDALPGDAPVTISSVAPVSTTAALAADAPIEHKVPDVVKESQEKAHASPEASAVPEEVEEKAAVEKELLDKVKEAPSTSEGTAGKGTEKTEDVVTPGEAAASIVAAASAAASAAVAGAVLAKDVALEKTQDAISAAQATATSAAAQLPDSVKEKLPESVQGTIDTTQKEEVREEVSPEAPAQVKESFAIAGESPEAAANTEAVEEKKAVETELLKEIKPVDAAANGEPREEVVSSEVPSTVQESIAVSGRAPEAATNTEAVEEKKAVEAELLKEVKPAEAAPEPAQKDTPATTEAPAATEAPATKETPALAVPATTEAPATSVAAATTETPAAETSKPAEQAKETNGTKAAVDPTTPAKPASEATPSSSKASNGAANGENKKKKNRLSAMFGKVKAKLSHKN
ncbi:hypothetical protein F4680DRAFT_21456 [Xylaria scruposa]|nr:hypothetical protein F4680DRAFT_21456 [Xylaria scruposa]